MSEGQVISSTPSLISKISMRTIKTRPAALAVEGKSTPLAIIVGKATGVKQIVDKERGDVYESLTGMFEANNLESGEVFQSGVLYLPQGIHDMVDSAVRQLKDGGQSVDFALEVKVVSASNKSGYSYEAVNLIPAKVVDPLQSLREDMARVRLTASNPPKMEDKPATTAQKPVVAPAKK